MILSVEHYEKDAARFGARYSRAGFEDIHREIVGYLPPVGSSILDVGAGSGRDAAALAERGYAVTAVEPSTAMQAWARTHYGRHEIEWIEDRLPLLEALRSSKRQFDFILCSAVLMHVTRADLTESFGAMASVLRSGGYLAASVRDQMPSDPPNIFHTHTDAVVIEAALKSNLRLIHSRVDDDHLGRADVSWRSFVFADGQVDARKASI